MTTLINAHAHVESMGGSDGRITEFDAPSAHAGPTGLSAGSDRCPPPRLIDKLWFAEPAGNTLA
jgi:hypothetical protein